MNKFVHIYIMACVFVLTTVFIWPLSYLQNAAAAKADADKTYKNVTDLDGELQDMLRQLEDAENQLKKKQSEADSDMMMANMVSFFLKTLNGKRGHYIALVCV